jgi:SNF2 family DNA or RNA helicase
LFNAIPAIKLFGIRVILLIELKNLVRPKITVSLSSGGSSGSRAFLNLDKIIQFQWKIALGETILETDDFLKLVQGLSGIVKLKQQYVHLDPLDLKALMESLAKQKKMNRFQLLQAAITGEYNGQKISMDDNTHQLIDSLLQIGTMEVPGDIHASLRPYQERGFSWLYKNTQLDFGSIIADDMGLSKTLQVIAMLQQIKDEGGFEKQKALVAVPTTLLTNWQKELEKFAPSLSFGIYHGNKRQLDLHPDIVITSNGVARSDLEILSKYKWRAIVIDEAQNIKNVSAAQTQAVKKIKADIRIALIGTPVENKLREYWSIFDFTFKGYLGSLNQFKDGYAAPMEMNRDRKILNHFLKITSPLILRRLKTDKTIISDLPEKMEQDYHASLTKEQAAIYQNVLDNLMAEIEAVDESDQKNAIKRKGLVLNLIMALKQICNHPSQYLKKEDASPDLSGKASLFMNLIENILENNEKVLVFNQFREMGDILQKMIKTRLDMDAMFLHGGSSRKQRDEMVNRFQKNPHEKIFILSIKAGGTGLNLTAASHVVLYGLWWNPVPLNRRPPTGLTASGSTKT